MEKRPFDVQRELDELVGPYEARRGRKGLERWGRIAARALLGACLAIAAVLAITFIFQKHITDAQKAPPPKRAVPVSIIPAK